MARHRNRSKRTPALSLIFCVLSAAPATAMGAPLINFRWFVTDLFRVQIDGSEVIRRGGTMGLMNTPPENIEDRRALHPIDPMDVVPGDLSCDEMEILGFSDWEIGHNLAREARAEFDGGLVPPETVWPSFWNWNSPVFVSMHIRPNIWGNLRSATMSVAVLDLDFEIHDVLNVAENRIAPAALDQVFEVRGRGYEGLYDAQIREKEVVFISSEECAEFLIFRLEIR